MVTDESSAILAGLTERGFFVTQPLLTSAECADVVSKQWRFVEAGSEDRVKRSDPSTWGSENWPQGIHGILQNGGAGHSEAAWAVRSHPNVLQTFAALYAARGVPLDLSLPSKGLLASFDGFSIVKPQSQRHFGACDWLHVDQRSSNEAFGSWQGLVNVGDDLSEEDHTFTCMPGTHRQFGAFFRNHPNAAEACRSKDWYKFKPEELGFFGGAPTIKVPVPKGGLLLWDSRLVHASSKSTAAVHKWRNVAYVCCTPRSWATENGLKRKRQHATDGRTATHLAHDERLFAKFARTYGKAQTALYQSGHYGDFSTAPTVVRELAGF